MKRNYLMMVVLGSAIGIITLVIWAVFFSTLFWHTYFSDFYRIKYPRTFSVFDSKYVPRGGDLYGANSIAEPVLIEFTSEKSVHDRIYLGRKDLGGKNVSFAPITLINDIPSEMTLEEIEKRVISLAKQRQLDVELRKVMIGGVEALEEDHGKALWIHVPHKLKPITIFISNRQVGLQTDELKLLRKIISTLQFFD